MAKNCKNCQKPIPPTRRKNSLYCSEECYKEHKATNDQKAYRNGANFLKELKKCENLLRQFYPVQTKHPETPFDYLDLMGFNWGIGTGETPHEGKILTTVGRFAYYLNNTSKTVRIWKLQGE